MPLPSIKQLQLHRRDQSWRFSCKSVFKRLNSDALFGPFTFLPNFETFHVFTQFQMVNEINSLTIQNTIDITFPADVTALAFYANPSFGILNVPRLVAVYLLGTTLLRGLFVYIVMHTPPTSPHYDWNFDLLYHVSTGGS